MDQLGQLLDEHRRSSSSHLSSSQPRTHSRSNSNSNSNSNSGGGGGAPPQSSSAAKAVGHVPLSPESASDDNDDDDDCDHHLAAAEEILAVTPSPPPAKKRGGKGGKGSSSGGRRGNGGTNPFDDDDDDDHDDDGEGDGKGSSGGAIKAKARARAKARAKKSGSREAGTGKKTSSSRSGGSNERKQPKKLRPPPPQPTTNPFDDDGGGVDGKPPPSPSPRASAATTSATRPSSSSRARSARTKTKTKGKPRTKAHRRSETAPAAPSAPKASDDRPPPLAELAIRTRSFRSAGKGRTGSRSRTAAAPGSGTGGDESVHAVCSVMSGKSGKSSTNPFDDSSSSGGSGSGSGSESDVSDHDDRLAAKNGIGRDGGPGDDEDSSSGSSAASTHVSDLSLRSARSVALAAALAAQAERYRAEVARREGERAAAAAAAAKEGDDGGHESDESRWEEGSDGEWRKVGGGGGGGGKSKGKEEDTNRADSAIEDATDTAHEEDGRWEEGSDGEWRRVVDDNGNDKARTKDNAAPKGQDASKKASSDDDEESGRELWEEGSDGEWRRVVKSKDEDGVDKVADAVDDKPDAEQVNDNADTANSKEDSPLEEEGVWEEDSDGEWRLVPKTKSKDVAQVVSDASAEGEGAAAKATAHEATTKTTKPRKHKLNPFDDSSSGSDDGSDDGEGRAEARRSSSGPVDLDGSDADDSDGEDVAPEEGSGPIDLDEVDSIDAEEKDGSGPIDLDEVDSLVASDQSEKDAVSSSSSENAENDSDELDDELREQIERRRAEEAAAAATASANAAQHPLLADPMTPRYALDHSVRVPPKDSSPTGPSLLARAKAKREAEERAKAELAEKRAREREMFGIPQAIGGTSFDAASSVMSPGDNKSHAEVSTTANSTLQRSVKSYGEQSEASSANAVAILPSLVNVQALSDLDCIPSGRRIDHFSSASPSHRRVESQDSGGGGGSANALSAREAIMAAASRHRSRFGSSRGHVARVSFDSNDPTASVKSADSNSTGPSQTSGRPPLLDRSSRAASLGKKFMTPLERQRELRRSQQMAAVASAVEGAASFDQDRLGRTGPGLGDGLARLKEISGEDVSVAARGDEFSIAPSLGGTVATEVTERKPEDNDNSLAAVAESDEPTKKSALPTMDEAEEEVSEVPVLRDFNAGLLRGFADTTPVSSSPVQSPSRPASSPGSSPRRRMNAARSKMKNVLSTMATVDKMKKSPTKQSPKKTMVRPNFDKEEQEGKNQAKTANSNNRSPMADDNAKVSGDAPGEKDAPITKDSSSEEAEAESDSDDESVGGASLDFGEPSKPAALPLRQHPDYSKYFAMLKASVPPSFVRRVCEIDGRDPAVLDMDPETPYEPQKNDRPSPVEVPNEIDDGDNDDTSGQPTSESEPLVVVTDGNDMATEAESNDPSPRGVADISVVEHNSDLKETTDDGSDKSTGKPDTSKVAALFANRSAPLTAASKPPRPPPGKLSDSGKGDVAALFAARSSESDTKPKGPAPGKLKDSGKDDVATLFASRSAESNDTKNKPKPGKLSDTGKGDVAAMFAARAADDASSKKDQAKPGKLAGSGKGDVAALFAARAKAPKPAVAPAVELSTPVSAAAEKIEQKEQENKDASRPPLKKDPEFAKYFKMLSMGIPMGAVQQALARDGKDPSIMELDHEKPYSSKPESKESERPPLCEDPEFAKYFKMLKMKLPIGAVQQAMARDGVDPSIMDMDQDKPFPNGASSSKEAAGVKKKSPARQMVLRKKLFWTSIDKSKLDKDSVWAQAQQESQNLEGLDYDMEEFATLFTQQKGKKGKSPSRGGPKRKKKATVQLIDGRREMNGSIVLRKFKHDYKQLADDLRKLDVGIMDENEIRAHMQLLPTKDEVKFIEAYLSKSKTEVEKEEAISNLGECEKYMIAMMGVQDAAKKFQCLLYRAQFDSRVEELEAEVKDLKEACKCVRSSDRLRKLLVFALRLGNTLNTDGSGESASAITLDSLLKMHEAKAFDKQTSVLHYLVSIIDKNDKDVLNVKEDLEPAKKSERIVVESLKKTLSDLSNGLDNVNEMGMEEAQRQAKGKDDKNMVADVNSVLAQTNIGQFAISADVRLKVLGAELNEAVEACSSLLKYFGEDAVMPSDVFFSTLNGFIAMFGTALEDNRRREKAKARKAKLTEKQKNEGGNSSRANSFTLRQASGSESSLADSRSKILRELSTGEALSKLKPVGQSSASGLSVDGDNVSTKDGNASSEGEEKLAESMKNNNPDSASEDANREDDPSKMNGNESNIAQEEVEDSDEDEAFEDAIETDEVSEKELKAFGVVSDSQEEQKEECVIS